MYLMIQRRYGSYHQLTVYYISLLMTGFKNRIINRDYNSEWCRENNTDTARIRPFPDLYIYFLERNVKIRDEG